MFDFFLKRKKKVMIDKKKESNSYNVLKEVICRCCRSLTFNETKTCSQFLCFLEVKQSDWELNCLSCGQVHE